MIGNDFVASTSDRTRRCSECGRKVAAGIAGLASIKKGRVKKFVCGEECRLTFDARIWDEFARENNKAEPNRRGTMSEQITDFRIDVCHMREDHYLNLYPEVRNLIEIYARPIKSDIEGYIKFELPIYRWKEIEALREQLGGLHP